MTSNIKNYSTTQSSNTTLNTINVAEGMLPSNLNNAIRALMKNTRDWYNDAQWVEYGVGSGTPVVAYASATSFTLTGADSTSQYVANRRVKAIGSSTGTIYGTISSSAFNGVTTTTVNVTWDSGQLSSETLRIYIGILTPTNTSIPLGVIGSAQIADGSVTTAKIANDAVNNDKIANNAVQASQLNANAVTEAKINANAVTTTKIADDAITTAKIADANVSTAKLADNAVTTAKITNSNVTADKLATNAVTTAKITDANVTTAKIADANVTTAKILDSNVTTAKLANSYTASGSGVVTIPNGTVGNSTVTLNGVANGSSLPAGYGILVESTTTQHTYNFHRLVPIATEVTTVAGISTAISNVNSNSSNINTVAGSISNVNTTAANITGVNSFGERYRVQAGVPSTSLNVGDLNFDTTANELKVYKSSGWAAAGSTVNGTSARFKYTASGSQTTFTGSDDNGNTLAYDAGFIDIYKNGSKLVNGTDVTVTSGTSVVLATGAVVGDIIDIVAYGTFDVAAISASSITSGTLNDARLPTTMAGKTLTTATVEANSLTARGDGSSADGKITLNCSQNSHGVKIQSPAHSAGQSYTLILPTSVGSANQVLASNGSSTNQLSWITAAETKPTVANVSQTIAPATATTINITGANFVSIPQKYK